MKTHALSISLGIFLIKTLAIVILPFRFLLHTSWFIDDGLITAQFSRNLWEGYGFSFDKVNLSSGTPILWASLMSPTHILNDIWAIKLTLILSSLLGVFAAFLVFTIAKSFRPDRVAWVAFTLALFTPTLFLTTMNGMETSLFAVLGLLALWQFYCRGIKTESDAIYLGITLGALHLTRADGVFLSGVLYLSWLSREKRLTRQLMVSALVAGMGGLIVLGWNYYTTGTFSPANSTGRRFIAIQSSMDANYHISFVNYVDLIIVSIVKLVKVWQFTTGAAILLPFAYLDMRRYRIIKDWGAHVALYGIMLAGYYHYLPPGHAVRYVVLPAMIFCIPLANLLDQVASRMSLSYGKSIWALVGLIVLISGRGYVEAISRPVLRLDNNGLSPITEWAIDHPDAVIAAKDHGELAYFGRAIVVDIAGVINPGALAALVDGNLCGYLFDEGATHVVAKAGSSHRVHKALFNEACIDLVFQSNGTWGIYALTQHLSTG